MEVCPVIGEFHCSVVAHYGIWVAKKGMKNIGTKLTKKRMRDTMRLTLGELNQTLEQRE